MRGTARALRNPPATAAGLHANSGSSSTSGIIATSLVMIALVAVMSRLGGLGKSLRTASAPSGFSAATAPAWIRSPSKVTTVDELAAQSFNAADAIVSKTGCTSVGDLLIT